MRRLLLIVPIVALAVTGLESQAQAAGGSPSGVAGTECGSTTHIAPGAAGVLQPGEVDWYDASIDSGELHLRLFSADPTTALTTSFTAAFTGGLVDGQWPRVRVYEWDKATDVCTEVDGTSCIWNLLDSRCWEHVGNPVTIDEPGDYQLSVEYVRGNNDGWAGSDGQAAPATSYVVYEE